MTRLLEVALPYFVSFLDDSEGKGSAFNADPGQSLGQEDPLEK